MLGTTIREHRLSQGLTLVALAERAGLSQPFLSQVENGRATPSMESLFRIATALDTTPQALFATAARTDAAIVARAADESVATIASPGESLRRLLLPGDTPFHVVELVGVPTAFRDVWQHPGFEAVYVLAGPVDIELDGELTSLLTGDFVSYPATLPHRFRSELGERARLLLVETQLSSAQRGAHTMDVSA